MILEQKRIIITKKHQSIVTFVMVLYHLLSAIFIFLYIIHEHKFRNSDKEKYCNPAAFINAANSSALIGTYNIYRSIISVIEIVWLTVVTYQLSKTIKLGSNDWTLKKNNKRLLVIIWTFITVYVLSSFFNYYMIVVGFNNLFEEQICWLADNFFNYIPIFLVLFAHLRNMQSFFKIMVTWMQN